MATAVDSGDGSWWAGIRPYFEKAPLAAFFLGVSSGFPYAMIGATLTTRLAQDGLDKKSITAFSLAFLVYNLKFLWAWIVDGVKLPIIGRLGQRVSWLILAGALVIAAVANLALVIAARSTTGRVGTGVLPLAGWGFGFLLCMFGGPGGDVLMLASVWTLLLLFGSLVPAAVYLWKVSAKAAFGSVSPTVREGTR
jgi:hypothetical protein